MLVLGRIQGFVFFVEMNVHEILPDGGVASGEISGSEWAHWSKARMQLTLLLCRKSSSS